MELVVRYIRWKLFFPSLLLFFGCSINKKNENFLIIDIKSNAQFYSVEKKDLQNLSRTIKIAFRADDEMYIALKKRHVTKDLFDKKNNSIHSTIVHTDTSYLYYVLKKGEKMGLCYGKVNDDPDAYHFFSRDSLLMSLGLDSTNFGQVVGHLGFPDTVITHQNKKTERFTIKKIRAEDFDTVYRYYDYKLKDINFTFSRTLDRLSKSKLTKVLYVYNSFSSNIDNRSVVIPTRKMYWEMAFSDVENTAEINKYFLLFNRDHKK